MNGLGYLCAGGLAPGWLGCGGTGGDATEVGGSMSRSGVSRRARANVLGKKYI